MKHLIAHLLLALCCGAASAQDIAVGPRPAYLVEQLEAGPLKERLAACTNKPVRRSNLSIGHRGAPLQYPEHTKESYEAAVKMGAGIVECDVTFTKDRELVCRHAQCDLHATTNILLIPELAAKCSQPFTPADPTSGKAASAKCCTSDLTVAEFKRLRGKMDGVNPQATSVADYVKTAAQIVKGQPDWRVDGREAPHGEGTVMTHKESIELFKRLGVGMTPELKKPDVAMPFENSESSEGAAGRYTQQAFAQQLIDEYKAAGVPASRVRPQSFDANDVFYWLDKEPAFGQQAVALASLRNEAELPAAIATLPALKARGVRTVAPPTWALVSLDANGKIVPSDYAQAIRKEGLAIITWTLERSGELRNGGGYYFQSIAPAIKGPGGYYQLLDALVQDVGVQGVFSDWAGTTSYYASCMGR
jgi:glycerophosphoryl diester phosphodiesterase